MDSKNGQLVLLWVMVIFLWVPVLGQSPRQVPQPCCQALYTIRANTGGQALKGDSMAATLEVSAPPAGVAISEPMASAGSVYYEPVIEVAEDESGNIYVLSRSNLANTFSRRGIITKLTPGGALAWRYQTALGYLPVGMVLLNDRIDVVGKVIKQYPEVGEENGFRLQLSATGTQLTYEEYPEVEFAAAATTYNINGTAVPYLVGKYARSSTTGVYRSQNSNPDYAFYGISDLATAAEIGINKYMLGGRSGASAAFLVDDRTFNYGRTGYRIASGRQVTGIAAVTPLRTLLIGTSRDYFKAWLVEGNKLLEEYTFASDQVAALGDVVVHRIGTLAYAFISGVTTQGVPFVTRLTLSTDRVDGACIIKRATRHVQLSDNLAYVSDQTPAIALGKDDKHLLYGFAPSSTTVSVGRLSFALDQSCLSTWALPMTYTTMDRTLYPTEVIAASKRQLASTDDDLRVGDVKSQVTIARACPSVPVDCYTQRCPVEVIDKVNLPWPSTCGPSPSDDLFARVKNRSSRTVLTHENITAAEPIDLNLSTFEPGWYLIEVVCRGPAGEKVLFTATVTLLGKQVTTRSQPLESFLTSDTPTGTED